MEDDAPECKLKIDWHDAPISLSLIDQLHGDAQGHLQAAYPDWKGTVKQMLADYFESKGISDVYKAALDVHMLNGEARMSALRADVEARARDASPISRNRRALCNQEEAYTELSEEIHTEGGTKKTRITFKRVPSGEFNSRLDEKQEKKGKAKIDSVMLNYKWLIEAADEQGFLQPTKAQVKPGKTKGAQTKHATVMSISAHDDIVAAKDKVIKNLRTQLSNTQKASGGSTDSRTAACAAEMKVKAVERQLEESKSKVLELQSEIQSLKQQVAINSAETAAAVANAKVEVMQQMMGGASFLSPPTSNRSV
jgi:hypothetical protein